MLFNSQIFGDFLVFFDFWFNLLVIREYILTEFTSMKFTEIDLGLSMWSVFVNAACYLETIYLKKSLRVAQAYARRQLELVGPIVHISYISTFRFFVFLFCQLLKEVC